MRGAIFLLRAFVFAGCAAIMRPACAQGDAATSHQEYQQWIGLELGYAPTRHLDLQAQYVWRNYGFFERFKGSYYYLQARYAISKHLYPDVQVRYVNTFGQDLFRLEAGLQYRYRAHKDLFAYRLGWFNERKQLAPDDRLESAPDNYLRNRFRYRRDLPKHWVGYASVEAYTRIEARGLELKRMAWIAGLARRLGGGREVLAEYLYQPEYHERGYKHMSSLTLGFAWDITKPHYHHGKASDRSDR